jgi:uncharacterized 2Fe-2S/4Fe-4S cluster protein (DUF4445 family)
MTITVNGKALELEAAQGGTLHDLLTRRGFRLNAPYGGGGRCGKCRVTIDNAGAPSPADIRLLTADDLAAGVRLACATRPVEGMSVRFEGLGSGLAQIATEGQAIQYAFSPHVRAREVALPAPTLADQAADLTRLARALGVEGLEASRSLLGMLPGMLRQDGWKATAVLRGGRLLGLTPRAPLGLAVDIGTTTLAGDLLDLNTGGELAVASALNPQKAFGDDVISRSDYAGGGGLKTLQDAVVSEIGAMVRRLVGQAGADAGDIYHAVFAGNTVMMHLFAGVTPEHIALSPFIPAFTGALDMPAAELGLGLNPEASATLLPCVAGYVGADIVAGMLAAGMREEAETTLLIDIGTNGEIALAASGRLFACSTAAGPAFEGAHITCGMGGVAGAINRAELDGGLKFSTIGNAKAAGICGSGLIDLVAGLLDCGAIDETGRLDRDAAPGWLQFDGDGVVLEPEAGIRLTGRDIREVQLAKGAIAAGVEVLANEAGIRLGDIRRVCLAGGFGSYMDKSSAGRIGLIPQELVERTSAIGNSSGAGAKAALLSREAMAEAERLAKAVRYVELSARKDFQELFMDKMMF